MNEQLVGDDVIFERIEHNEFPVQHAMHMLRLCAVPKMIYITRITPPSACIDIINNFDDQLMKTAGKKLDVDADDIYIRDRLCQRVKTGGFGMLSSSKRHYISYIASLSIAMRFDVDMIYNSASLKQKQKIELFIEHINSQLTLSKVKNLSDLLLPTTYDDFLTKARDSDFIWTHELYKRLCRALCAADDIRINREDVLSGNYEKKERAKNVREKGVSTWLTVLPTSKDTFLIDEHYRIAARRRLGTTPFNNKLNITRSECAYCNVKLNINTTNTVNGSVWHGLDCTHITGTLMKLRHDDIVNSIVVSCSAAGIHTDVEPVGLSSNNRKRVDIIAHVDPTIAIDVTVVNTSAFSYRNHLSKTILDQACKNKTDKHEDTRQRINGTFKGFVMSTHGAYQAEVSDVVGMIAAKAVENGVAYTNNELTNQLKASIAITIQRGNAIIMLGTHTNLLAAASSSTNKYNINYNKKNNKYSNNTFIINNNNINGNQNNNGGISVSNIIVNNNNNNINNISSISSSSSSSSSSSDSNSSSSSSNSSSSSSSSSGSVRVARGRGRPKGSNRILNDGSTRSIASVFTRSASVPPIVPPVAPPVNLNTNINIIAIANNDSISSSI